MNTFFQCIVSVGLLIIVGAAGSVDINVISLTKAMFIITIGLTMMLIGVIGCNATKKRVVKRKQHHQSHVHHRKIS